MTQTPDWRARRWAATHQRIYDAAIGLIQQHGFDAVSVGQIARAAEVSVPTFYAHYPSKEHVLMQLPTAEEIQALVAALPVDLPVGDRLRRAVPLWFGSWSPEFRESQLQRWKIIAGVPALRTRAAEFERATAGLITEAMAARARSTGAGSPPPPRDGVVVAAYMAAFTSGLLAWADGDGRRTLEELVGEAFDAL